MTIHKYLQIHDFSYMQFKSLIHEIHNIWKFNTWRMSITEASFGGVSIQACVNKVHENYSTNIRICMQMDHTWLILGEVSDVCEKLDLFVDRHQWVIDEVVSYFHWSRWIHVNCKFVKVYVHDFVII